MRAAAEAAHGGPVPFVLTARAENYLHGRVDLADTIARLQAYQEAGADVLFAPRVVDPAELRQLLAAVDRPVSVLVTPGRPERGELAELGVSRISVGGAIAAAAYGFAVDAVHRAAATQGTPELLGAGGRRPRRHGRQLRGPFSRLTATVTSISTAPPRGSAATPMAERVWRPASPKTSARTLAGAVHHGGLLVEVRRRRDIARHGEHPARCDRAIRARPPARRAR